MKKNILLLSLVFGLISVASAMPRIIKYSLLTKRTVMYQKAEWDIVIESVFKDAYNSAEVALDMHIVSPSGKQISLPCFFVEGSSPYSKWKARFTPIEIGVYKYRFELRNEQQTIVSPSSNFTVSKVAGDGFIQLNNSWSLKYSSGKPFRGIGENIGWEARKIDDQKYSFRYLLPKLKANGGNFFRTFVHYRNVPLEWNRSEDTKGLSSHRYKNSTDKYHAVGIRHMDELVELADSLGMHVMLMIEWQNNLRPDHSWPNNPYNKVNGGPAATPEDFFTNPQARTRFKDRLRYMIARWGYSPSIGAWELMNEIDNAAYDKHKDVGGTSVKDVIVISHKAITDWHREMAAYLRANDPYQHIITTSISHREIAGLFETADMDINQQHIYKTTDSIGPIIVAKQAKHGKPFAIGEFGFRWEDGDAQYWNDYSFHFRKGMWYGLFNPTPILPLTWWWELFDSKNGLTDLKAIAAVNRKMLSAGGGDFETVPCDSKNLVGYAVRCGKQYFVYLLNNSEHTVQSSLSVPTLKGKLKMSRFDTKSLTESSVKTVDISTALTLPSIELKAREELILIIEDIGKTK